MYLIRCRQCGRKLSLPDAAVHSHEPVARHESSPRGGWGDPQNPSAWDGFGEWDWGTTPVPRKRTVFMTRPSKVDGTEHQGDSSTQRIEGTLKNSNSGIAQDFRFLAKSKKWCIWAHIPPFFAMPPGSEKTSEAEK